MDIEQIYQDYFVVVYKYILSISGDPLTAEEITQETFFKALKSIDEFRGDSDIRTWLCRIARNLYHDHKKKQSRQVELPDNYEELAIESSGGQHKSIEDRYIEGVEVRKIHRILHTLREPYKEVFSLRALGELSFSDIGDLFGKTDSWARVTYHRARLMIMEEMKDE